MQNKLNEILELCVEKSKDDLFYHFHYNPMNSLVMIEKVNSAIKNVKFKDRESSIILRNTNRDIDIVLSIMQNE